MCDQAACQDTCKRWASAGTVTAALLASAVAYQVVSVVLLPLVVAAAGLVGAAVALAVLRWRRRRPVLSRRVLRRVGVTAASIPAAAVPLAIGTGVPLFMPVVALAGLVIVAGVIRRAASAPLVVYAHPALLAARRRPLPAAVLEPTRVIPASETVPR